MVRRTLILLGAFSIFLYSCEGEKKETAPTSEASPQEVKEDTGKGGPFAEVIKLAKDKGCFSCHDVDTKKVGPAYRDVAKRYSGKEGAVEELVISITKGSMGKWGSIPMTAQPVDRAQAKKLAEWILSLK